MTTALRASDSSTRAALPARNPGTPLELSFLTRTRINRSAVERRAATLTTRRTVKKEWQAAWLLRAVSFMDLTTLSGDDTPGNVRRLCAKARQPVRDELLEALGMAGRGLHVGAVCVYHALVPDAVEALRGSGIPVAAVSTGFPAGQTPFDLKLAGDPPLGRGGSQGDRHRDLARPRADRRLAGALRRGARVPRGLRAGAHEGHPGHRRARHAAQRRAREPGVHDGGRRLHQDLDRQGAGERHAALGLVMVRAIREYQERTGYKVGFKPAGGIRTAKQALDWLVLMKEELGVEWTMPRALPARRERAAHRHRTPARALRHRALLGRASAPDGMTGRPLAPLRHGRRRPGGTG